MRARRHYDGTMPKHTHPLGAARARELAVAASCDPRTVRKEYDEPGSVGGLVGDRIRTALAAHGLRDNRPERESSAA